MSVFETIKRKPSVLIAKDRLKNITCFRPRKLYTRCTRKSTIGIV